FVRDLDVGPLQAVARASVDLRTVGLVPDPDVVVLVPPCGRAIRSVLDPESNVASRWWEVDPALRTPIDVPADPLGDQGTWAGTGHRAADGKHLDHDCHLPGRRGGRQSRRWHL